MELINDLLSALGGYSADLEKHVNGEVGTSGALNDFLLPWIGCVSAAIILNYYFGIFNRAGFNTLVTWFLNIIAACLFSGIWAYYNLSKDINAGFIVKELNIADSDPLKYATAFFIFTLLFSVLLSLLVKWFSKVNKKIPF
jgi:hypothetical protein